MNKLIVLTLFLAVFAAESNIMSFSGSELSSSENPYQEKQHEDIDRSGITTVASELQHEILIGEETSLELHLSLLQRSNNFISAISESRRKGAEVNDDIDATCTIDCFVAGTPVLTPSGYQSIETLELGDKVMVYNFLTDTLVARKITDKEDNFVTLTYKVTIGGELFQVTGDHKFYVQGQGWVKVQSLQPGLQILTDQGSSPVQSVIPVSGNVQVYNIAAFHIDDNYIVGNTKIVVHR